MTTEDQLNNLIILLENIGLRNEEARVYLATLELGPSSVWNIYLKSGVKRPTCYVILDDLVRRGLASKSFDKKKAIYSVSDPSEIAKEFDRKREQFAQNLSQFEALASKAQEKPTIRMYEGEEGLRQAYNLSLTEPEGTEILIYGSEKVLTAYPDFFKSYISERITKNIRIKLLLADVLENYIQLDSDKDELRETRFLPKEQFDPRAELDVYNDKIVNVAYSETTPFATVIESPSMAYDEKQKFMILWNLAQRYHGQNKE